MIVCYVAGQHHEQDWVKDLQMRPRQLGNAAVMIIPSPRLQLRK